MLFSDAWESPIVSAKRSCHNNNYLEGWCTSEGQLRVMNEAVWEWGTGVVRDTSAGT